MSNFFTFTPGVKVKFFNFTREVKLEKWGAGGLPLMDIGYKITAWKRLIS
jgi:hypothetical protein